MANRVRRGQPATQRRESAIELTVSPSARSSRDAGAAEAYDAILDDIDAVLETDAEEYVRSFVQKGGQ
ncbi:MAG: ubiquitin-like protein Pup [Propionicimonas sp.]